MSNSYRDSITVPLRIPLRHTDEQIKYINYLLDNNISLVLSGTGKTLRGRKYMINSKDKGQPYARFTGEVHHVEPAIIHALEDKKYLIRVDVSGVIVLAVNLFLKKSREASKVVEPVHIVTLNNVRVFALAEIQDLAVVQPYLEGEFQLNKALKVNSPLLNVCNAIATNSASKGLLGRYIYMCEGGNIPFTLHAGGKYITRINRKFAVRYINAIRGFEEPVTEGSESSGEVGRINVDFAGISEDMKGDTYINLNIEGKPKMTILALNDNFTVNSITTLGLSLYDEYTDLLNIPNKLNEVKTYALTRQLETLQSTYSSFFNSQMLKQTDGFQEKQLEFKKEYLRRFIKIGDDWNDYKDLADFISANENFLVVNSLSKLVTNFIAFRDIVLELQSLLPFYTSENSETDVNEVLGEDGKPLMIPDRFVLTSKKLEFKCLDLDFKLAPKDLVNPKRVLSKYQGYLAYDLEPNLKIELETKLNKITDTFAESIKNINDEIRDAMPEVFTSLKHFRTAKTYDKQKTQYDYIAEYFVNIEDLKNNDDYKEFENIVDWLAEHNSDFLTYSKRATLEIKEGTVLDERERIKSIMKEKPVFTEKISKLKIPYGASSIDLISAILNFTTRYVSEKDITEDKIFASHVLLFGDNAKSIQVLDKGSVPDTAYQHNSTKNGVLIPVEKLMTILHVNENHVGKIVPTGMLYSLESEFKVNLFLSTWQPRSQSTSAKMMKELGYSNYMVRNANILLAVARIKTILSEKGYQPPNMPDYVGFFKRLLMGSRSFKSKGYTQRFLNSKPELKTMVDDIANLLVDYFQDEINYEQMDTLERENLTYATAYQTKQAIKPSVQALMAETKFKGETFNFVEFDNDLDTSLLPDIEASWLQLEPHLPKLTTPLELRFRKLGKHKAIGVFFPATNCIGIDIRNIQAFVHEYGHAIDYRYTTGKPLSLQDEFYEIRQSYSRALRNNSEAIPSKISYYLTPTEIFARAYELYMSTKVNSDFLKPEMYEPQYTAFSDEIIPKIISYFDNLLNK